MSSDDGKGRSPAAPLSLERLAEALAYRTYYAEADRATIYARLGVSEDEVRSAGHAWGAQLAQGLSKADATLSMRFARTFSRIEQKIRSRRPSPESIEPSAKQDAPEVPQAKPLPAFRALEQQLGPDGAVPKGPIDLPSYLLPNAEPVEDKSSNAEAPKKRAGAQVELPPHIAAARGRPVARGTMAVEESALRGPALPFDPNQPVRLPPPAPPPPPPKPGAPVPARTEEMSPTPAASPEVPFRKYVELRVHLERCKDASKAAEKAQLSEAQRAAAEAYWGPKVAGDPNVQEAFNSMRKHVEAALD